MCGLMPDIIRKICDHSEVVKIQRISSLEDWRIFQLERSG